ARRNGLLLPLPRVVVAVDALHVGDVALEVFVADRVEAHLQARLVDAVDGEGGSARRFEHDEVSARAEEGGRRGADVEGEADGRLQGLAERVAKRAVERDLVSCAPALRAADV